MHTLIETLTWNDRGTWTLTLIETWTATYKATLSFVFLRVVVVCVFKCCCFSGLVQEVLSFIYLERESLRLLGLRDLDLDLERDLPPPRPSSYNLILTMCHLIFCSKRSTTSHSLHNMILSKYQMVCPPTNNILLVQYLQILLFLSHKLTADRPVQRHRACQERTPCRPCWQTQPLLHQSCEDKIEEHANIIIYSYQTCSHGSWCR